VTNTRRQSPLRDVRKIYYDIQPINNGISISGVPAKQIRSENFWRRITIRAPPGNHGWEITVEKLRMVVMLGNYRHIFTSRKIYPKICVEKGKLRLGNYD
jgi:hypothetical protein